MPFSLFDDMKQAGFHSSIVTTYSVDPAFYDANIQYRQRTFGCQNNLLIADAAMLHQALDQMPEAFLNAGRKYLIVPISGVGCFHPKIFLRYGKSKARLVVGSANATSAGWGSNREVLANLEWSEAAKGSDNDAQLRLITKAHDWLIKHLPVGQNPDLDYKLELLHSQSPWLSNAERGVDAHTMEDGSQIDLLMSDPEAPLGLAHQLIAHVEGKVERLVVISPYWDDRLEALRRLHEAFGGPSTHIFLTLADDPGSRQSTFPTNALSAELKPKFHPLCDRSRHRFLHAKIIMVQTRKYDYLLYGSANCTMAALGNRKAPGANCETAVFRRLPRGTIDHHLELDYALRILARDIALPEKQDSAPPAPRTFDPGRIERKGNRLLWSCPTDISADGAHFLISDNRLPVAFLEETRPQVAISREIAEATIVVRVELINGRVSRPVIVLDSDMLKASAPNPLTSNLKRKLDAVLSGESDLIELARDIHLIFENNGAKKSISLASGRGRSLLSSTAVGRDYESPLAFREAMALSADLHSDSITHPENPALQLVLQIVLRGIIQLQDSETIDSDDTESAEALAVGEDQDDAGTEEMVSKSPRPIAVPAASSVVLDQATFDRNRASLLRAIDRFEEHVAALSGPRNSIDLEFVTRTLFMIYLMLYGCSRPYVVGDGPTKVLIPFSGVGTRQQDDGFLMRAARLMSRIWGSKFRDGLMARLPLDLEATVLPTPILTLVILSRWILAAILTEARSTRGAKSLAAILEKQVPQMFEATTAFAPLVSPQIEASITQMAKQIGIPNLQAQGIQTTMRELSSERM